MCLHSAVPSPPEGGDLRGSPQPERVKPLSIACAHPAAVLSGCLSTKLSSAWTPGPQTQREDTSGSMEDAWFAAICYASTENKFSRTARLGILRIRECPEAEPQNWARRLFLWSLHALEARHALLALPVSLAALGLRLALPPPPPETHTSAILHCAWSRMHVVLAPRIPVLTLEARKQENVATAGLAPRTVRLSISHSTLREQWALGTTPYLALKFSRRVKAASSQAPTREIPCRSSHCVGHTIHLPIFHVK